jgi:hypothetical protein
MVPHVLVMVLMVCIGRGRFFGTGQRAHERVRGSTDKHDEQQREDCSTH